mmetsp:Transcript_8756/g.24989  ORF Transcript_8756/g.24989 Transcript_8756/m.24989 type:complete len:294 (+) Transcript_8756:260-1141(+)
MLLGIFFGLVQLDIFFGSAEEEGKVLRELLARFLEREELEGEGEDVHRVHGEPFSEDTAAQWEAGDGSVQHAGLPAVGDGSRGVRVLLQGEGAGLRVGVAAPSQVQSHQGEGRKDQEDRADRDEGQGEDTERAPVLGSLRQRGAEPSRAGSGQQALGRVALLEPDASPREHRPDARAPDGGLRSRGGGGGGGLAGGGPGKVHAVLRRAHRGVRGLGLQVQVGLPRQLLGEAPAQPLPDVPVPIDDGRGLGPGEGNGGRDRDRDPHCSVRHSDRKGKNHRKVFTHRHFSPLPIE